MFIKNSVPARTISLDPRVIIIATIIITAVPIGALCERPAGVLTLSLLRALLDYKRRVHSDIPAVCGVPRGT